MVGCAEPTDTSPEGARLMRKIEPQRQLEDDGFDGFILLTALSPNIIPLHPQHIRKLVRKGLFPAPVNVGGRTAFRRSDLREFIRDPGAYRRPAN